MKDDEGAMMLLTAVILVIGFIALSGLADRLAQLPEQAELDRQDDFFSEADRVATGIAEMMDLYSCADAGDRPHIEATMKHLQIAETGRGFGFWYDTTECQAGIEAMTFKLAGAESGIVLRIAP